MTKKFDFKDRVIHMSKRETIDIIRHYNPSAQAVFLASFEHEDLLAYLHQLQELERDRQLHACDHAAETMSLAMA